MTTEQNLDVTRRIINEGFNQGDFSRFPSYFQTGYVEHQFGLHQDVEGLQKDISFLRKAFPDLHLTIDHMAADGDLVWLHMTARGTNLGGMMGQPNGKAFEISVFDLLRFNDGKVVEHWGSPDRFAQMTQLGLLPGQKERQ